MIGSVAISLVVAVAIMQGFLLLLARGLGLRLHRTAMATALLLPVLMLAPWLDGDPVLAPCDVLAHRIPDAPAISNPDTHGTLNDAIFQFLPWEIEVRRALRQGRLPLWSDLLEGGSSPWINPQAGVLSPIAMAARVVPLRFWLLAGLILKMLVACEGTWLLARVLGAGRASALVAAASYAAAGGLMSWAVFPHSRAAAWVPWLVVAVIRLLRRPDFRKVVTTAVITACLALAGHPEIATGGGLLAAGIGLALLSRRQPLLRSIAAAALAALLGLGLAAVQVLPFLQALPGSSRAVDISTRPLPDLGLVWSNPATWLLTPRVLLCPLNGYAWGTPYSEPFEGPFNWPETGASYVGLLMLAGAVIAVLLQRSRRALVLALAACACLLLSTRPLPLLLPLALPLPLLKGLAYQRLLLVAALCLCMLGALGLDRLLRRPQGPLLWLILLGTASVSIALKPVLPVLVPWLLLASAVLLARWQRRWSVWLLLVTVMVIDLVPLGRAHLPRGHAAMLYPQTPLLERLAAPTGELPPPRVTAGGRLLYPSLLPVYGVAEIRPHNPMAPAGQMRVLRAAFGFGDTYFSSFSNLDHPLLDFLSVDLVVTPSPAIAGFEPVEGGHFGGLYLLRNTEALPRVFITRRFDFIASDDLEAWIGSLDDPATVALQSEKTLIMSHPPDREPVGTVTVRDWTAGKAEIEVSRSSTGVLATSLPFPAGWSARSEDLRFPRVTINGAFFGALLPPESEGEPRRVTLRFLPPGLLTGTMLSALSALALGVALWRDRRTRRHHAVYWSSR